MWSLTNTVHMRNSFASVLESLALKRIETNRSVSPFSTPPAVHQTPRYQRTKAAEISLQILLRTLSASAQEVSGSNIQHKHPMKSPSSEPKIRQSATTKTTLQGRRHNRTRGSIAPFCNSRTGYMLNDTTITGDYALHQPVAGSKA